jgi:hypothetical protein
MLSAEEHLAAHGVDIAHGVGRGDRAVGPGVIHHRREEVGGLDQGALIVQAEDGGVIRLAQPHQHVGIFSCREEPGQLAHDLR